jgi:hypothetical protein
MLPFVLFITVICGSLFACSRPAQKQEQTLIERQALALAPLATPTSGAPDLRPPQPAEAQEAIR